MRAAEKLTGLDRYDPELQLRALSDEYEAAKQRRESAQEDSCTLIREQSEALREYQAHAWALGRLARKTMWLN